MERACVVPSQSVLPCTRCQPLCNFFVPGNHVHNRRSRCYQAKVQTHGYRRWPELPKEVQLSEAFLKQIIRGVMEQLRQSPRTTENTTDGTNKPLCPVSALLAYMVMRGKGPRPLFIFQDGKPLSRPWFVTEIKRALSSAGIVESHTQDSSRTGVVTTADKQGVEDSTIKMLGHWKSSAYQRYIKTPR